MFLEIKEQWILLLIAISLFIISIGAQQVPAQCNGRVSARQEWRDLTQQQKDAFIQALQCVYNNGQYQRFTALHLSQLNAWHKGSYFLPAHRAMLHAFEAELRRCNPAVVLPYWDSSLDSQWPSRSPVWNDMGRPVRDACMTTGPFVNWLGARNTCIIRGFTFGDPTNALSSSQVLGEMVRTTNNYEDFEAAIEYGQHAYVHIVVGGINQKGDMFDVMFSAGDPIFYLHHAFIDKLWADWQNYDRANRLYQFNGNHQNSPVSINAPIPGLTGYSVSSVLDTLTLCYAYANPGVVVPPSSTAITTSTTNRPSTTTVITSSTTVSSFSSRPGSVTTSAVLPTTTLIFNNGTGNFTFGNSTITNQTTTIIPTTTSIILPTDRVPDPIPAAYCQRMMGCDLDKIREIEKQQQIVYIEVYKKELEGKLVYGPGQTADSYKTKPPIVNGYVTEQEITKLVPYFSRPAQCKPRPPKPPGNSGITSVEDVKKTETTSYAYKMAEISSNMIVALSVAAIVF